MTQKFDPRAYGGLLAEYLPGIIKNERENERMIELAGRLIKKGDKKRSPEENRLLDLIVTLIEDFEDRAYPIRQTSPVVALRELMREHELKQTDMTDIFGSQGTVSQVLNGKREISKAQARKLSERFKLPIDVFI
jgi:HTH-type transcriptional regulator/antitoxin HigA